MMRAANAPLARRASERRGADSPARTFSMLRTSTEAFDASARGAARAIFASNAGVDRIDRVAGLHVAIRPDEDLGVLIAIGIGDHDRLIPGAREAIGAEEDLARLSFVDADVALIGVDDLGLAVSLKVEDR